MSTPTELSRLLIKEVSGVDDPANEIPGWMVAKASKFKASVSIGPDQTWDVAAAEKRIRTATGATSGPNAKYAACFLWYDPDGSDADGDGLPDQFGDYKFLVCDEVDGKIVAMPAAIRAASSRLSGSSLSDADKSGVQKIISALEEKAGIGDSADKAAPTEDAPTFVTRLKSSLGLGTRDTGKDDIDMTADELKTALDAQAATIAAGVGEAVGKAVAEAVTKAAPVEGAAPAAAPEVTPADADVPALTIEAVGTAIEAGIAKAMEPVNQILEALVGRQENTEKKLGIAARTSLVGQEGGDTPAPETDATKSTEAPKATVGSAITKALRNPGKPVYLAGTSSGAAAAL